MSSREAAARQNAMEGILVPRLPRRLRGIGRLIRRQPLAAGGLVILVVVVAVALVPDLVARQDPVQVLGRNRLLSPSSEHWFGTDHLGRDIFSRVVHGARISVVVSLGTVAIGVSAGTALGLISGYTGGIVDLVVQRVVDVFMAFPLLLAGLAVVSILGPGTFNVIVALSIAIIPNVSRVVRGVVLSEKERDYVQAARAVGCRGSRIIGRHLLPNVAAPVIIVATSIFGAAVVAEATLSFLGLGVPPPQPSWGGMLSGAARQYLEVAPWMAIFPGLAIAFFVLGVNFMGDALRDELDPRLRGSKK